MVDFFPGLVAEDTAHVPLRRPVVQRERVAQPAHNAADQLFLSLAGLQGGAENLLCLFLLDPADIRFLLPQHIQAKRPLAHVVVRQLHHLVGAHGLRDIPLSVDAGGDTGGELLLCLRGVQPLFGQPQGFFRLFRRCLPFAEGFRVLVSVRHRAGDPDAQFLHSLAAPEVLPQYGPQPVRLGLRGPLVQALHVVLHADALRYQRPGGCLPGVHPLRGPVPQRPPCLFDVAVQLLPPAPALLFPGGLLCLVDAAHGVPVALRRVHEPLAVGFPELRRGLLAAVLPRLLVQRDLPAGRAP